ncbi:MAG TPA: class I SAM-dependent methyltransferase [Gemmatimonadales bacterium]|nr:class I SAM-dependent methyltransferase [Gemmatimonadales bacterium]
MNELLTTILAELEAFGRAHDARTAAPAERYLNLTPEAGALLALLVRATRARRVLEIGTSNGYSTLWLADAVAETGGRVTTIERLAAKRDAAVGNLTRAGLASRVTFLLGEAAALLRDEPDATYDFIFLDAERRAYPGWWPDLARVWAPGGVLVVDNALSHAEEVAPFAELLQTTPGVSTVLVPIGRGELLAYNGPAATA